MRVACWVVLVLGLLYPMLLMAQSQPVELKAPCRVVWALQEEIDEDEQPMPMTPGLWKRELVPLQFKFFNNAENDRLAKRCPFKDLKAGRICPELSSTDADLVIVGRITAETRPTGPTNPDVGSKVNLKFKVWRIDNGEEIATIKQPSYATGANSLRATEEAIRRVAKPIAIRLSNLVAVKLGAYREGAIHVRGFSSSAQRDDLFTGLRVVPDIETVRQEEEKADYTVFRVGYRNVTWGGLVTQINNTQGSGLQARIAGNELAEATYDPVRAFRLQIAVTEASDRTGDPIFAVKAEKLPETIETELTRIGYLTAIRFPVRLAHNGKAAQKEMKLQYGGDLVLLPLLEAKGGELRVQIEVRSTFSGRLFVLHETLQGSDLSGAIRKAVDMLADKLILTLVAQRKRMPRLKREQFEAWRARTGY